MPRRDSNESEQIEEANVLPVMNIMFLLIPALLLAMEVASLAGIPVSSPRMSNTVGKAAEPDPNSKSLDLAVRIQSDGFRVSSAEQQHGADAGKATDSSTPTIPLARPDASSDDYDRYDYDALSALAYDLKQSYPHESVVSVSAENDVPAQVLINTMDALRGYDCSLAGVGADDEIPSSCMFFRPVVEAH